MNETVRKCTSSGCIKTASHGFRAGSIPEVCSQHARAGMMNVVSGRPKRGRNNDTDT